MITIAEIQKQQKTWALKNFGPDQDSVLSFLGVVEELGELAKEDNNNELLGMTVFVGLLAHAHLKQVQGIRTTEDHEAKAKDAVGDMFIFLCDYCTRRDWDFESIVLDTWFQVKNRDWKERPHSG